MPGTKLFSRTNYQVLRGFGELLTTHTLTDAEWQEIRSFFDQRCAFCNISDTGNPRTGLIPDHLIPAKNFGAFCIGNVVPACQDCNDRRGKMAWRDYIHRYHCLEAAQRIDKIEAYLKDYPYEVGIDPYAELTDIEKRDYSMLLADWNALWKRAQALRDGIRKRCQVRR